MRLHIDVIFARRALLAKNTLWTMLCGIQEKPLIIAKPAARSIRAKSTSLTTCARTRTTRHSVVKYAVSDYFNSIAPYTPLCYLNANERILIINTYKRKEEKDSRYSTARLIKTRFRYVMGRFQKFSKSTRLPSFYKLFSWRHYSNSYFTRITFRKLLRGKITCKKCAIIEHNQ